MKEQGPKGFDFGMVISNLEARANPTNKYIVESLEELRISRAYNIFRTSGERGLFQGARIIIKQPDSMLVSIVSDFSGEDLERKKFNQLVNTIRKGNRKIEVL